MFGIFKRKTPRAARSRRPPMVEVSYRELYEPPGDQGYVFVWRLPFPPSIGHRVFVRGNDGRIHPGAVIDADASVPAGFTFDELLDVSRLATSDELGKAHTRYEKLKVKARQDEVSWLNMARRAAGLPTSGRARSAPPEGFAQIPPVGGTASRPEADRHGRAWWKVMHRAVDQNRDADEIAAYREIAKYWFSVRDNGNS